MDRYVAPHDGCVDWNYILHIERQLRTLSHPTMGAWIEIESFGLFVTAVVVAPHDGCVDWNFGHEWNTVGIPSRTPRWVRGLKSRNRSLFPTTSRSHPTMGAWIEIIFPTSISFSLTVAPHDGCVDWNLLTLISIYSTNSRTPRWVRGLKY